VAVNLWALEDLLVESPRCTQSVRLHPLGCIRVTVIIGHEGNFEGCPSDRKPDAGIVMDTRSYKVMFQSMQWMDQVRLFRLLRSFTCIQSDHSLF